MQGFLARLRMSSERLLGSLLIPTLKAHLRQMRHTRKRMVPQPLRPGNLTAVKPFGRR